MVRVSSMAAGLSALSMVCVLSTSGSAEAQQAKPAGSEDTTKAEARARFEEGIKQAEAGDHEAARLKFNQAWALLKSPAILFNLARSEQLSGHLVEALEHYRAFAKMPPDPKITDAQRQRAAEAVTELSKRVGQIEIEAPSGARLSVDGHPVDSGNTEPVPVTVGRHVVEAIVDGKARSVTVETQAGTITKATLTENAATPPAPPPRRVDAELGTPLLKEQGPGFWTTGRIAGAGIVGAGLVAAGIGVVFHFSAASAGDEAEKLRAGLPPSPSSSTCNPAASSAEANRATCAELATAANDQRDQENLRTGLFIGGGALIVGGAVLFLLSSPKGDKSEPTRGITRVLPIATGRDAGLAVVGRF